MDSSKANGLSYIQHNGTQGPSAVMKRTTPPRSSSYLGISHIQDEIPTTFEDYLDRNNPPQNYEKRPPSSTLRSSHITTSHCSENLPLIHDSRRYQFHETEDHLKENLTRDILPLKEKISSNDLFDYNEQWLCDIDLFREKMRIQHLLVNGGGIQRRPRNGRYTRYSESAKDTRPTTVATIFDSHAKRRIRARSESEPNDICNLSDWTPSNNSTYHQAEDLLHKRSRDHSPVTLVHAQNNRSVPKRESPPKVLIYGCQRSPRSPALLKRTTRQRSSPVIGSPRMTVGNVRRIKSKSPSPTFHSKTPLLRPCSPFRKSKSVTPPPPPLKSLLLPIEKLKIKKEREFKPVKSHNRPTGLEKSDTDGSSLEDDDDFDEGTDNNEDASSTDSEASYGANIYLIDSENLQSLLPPSTAVNSSVVHNRGQLSSPFVPSLFPYVPPYLAFSTHSEKGPPISEQLQKVLKWKLTSIMPRVVRRVLTNSGFRLLKKTNDWMGTWGKHMKSPLFKTIRSYQKINHLPGSFKIGRKDACWRNLQTCMIKYGKKEFGFMPKTYVIPQDLKALRKSWPKYSQRNYKWIIKPPASARGTGIKVVNRWSQIPKRKPIIVQRYIERPLLINGSKFDLRLYVLVTSINPLRVFMYNDGLARFASVKYSDKSDTLSDRCMHLTNYSINKLSSNYAKNEDANACQGHKWTIKSLWSFLAGRGVNTNRLWSALRNLVLRTILAGENSINSMIKLNVESKYNCFELFGFDVILDEELVPWLLEVNISPSLHSELPLDLHVKGPLVQAVFNTALYHVPPKLSSDQIRQILNEQGLKGPLCFDKRIYVTHLSRVEKLKHNQFTRKTMDDREDYLTAILENLTPDDIRCLINTEDELVRSAPLERIFPGPNTYKYLNFTETPRYYNRLLDAWENRYHKNRSAGIRCLQELCDQKYHLDVAPAPVKKDSNGDNSRETTDGQQQRCHITDGPETILLGTENGCDLDKKAKQKTTTDENPDSIKFIADREAPQRKVLTY